MNNTELLRELGWSEDLIRDVETGRKKLALVATDTIQFEVVEPVLEFSTSSTVALCV